MTADARYSQAYTSRHYRVGLLRGKPINPVFLVTARTLTVGEYVLQVDAKTSPRLVGIATRDMRVYFRLVQELKRRNAPFRSMLPDEEIPADVKVVITTNSEQPRNTDKKVVTVGRGYPYRLAVDRALNSPDKSDSFHEVVVGIDPGKTIGIATLGDGKIIHTALLHGTGKLRSEVNYIFRAFPSNRRLIRIGSAGSRPLLDDIRNSLSQLRSQIPIELVDEHRTSQRMARSEYDLPRDIIAAIQIASRLGKKLGVN